LIHHSGIPGTGLRLLLVTAVLWLSGCDYIVDCLDGDGPVFNRGSLPSPVLNQVYEETIRVSIENEPRDDWFRYAFEYSGRLPQGISTIANGRDFILTGTPTEMGTFSIEVLVQVRGRDNNPTFSTGTSGLCYTSRAKKYTFSVAPL